MTGPFQALAHEQGKSSSSSIRKSRTAADALIVLAQALLIWCYSTSACPTCRPGPAEKFTARASPCPP